MAEKSHRPVAPRQSSCVSGWGRGRCGAGWGLAFTVPKNNVLLLRGFCALCTNTNQNGRWYYFAPPRYWHCGPGTPPLTLTHCTLAYIYILLRNMRSAVCGPPWTPLYLLIVVMHLTIVAAWQCLVKSVKSVCGVCVCVLETQKKKA